MEDLDAFDIQPSYPAKRGGTARRKTMQFGDGYVMDAADGINTKPQKWSLTYTNITDTLAESLMTLLDSALFVRLTWTPPGELAPRTFRLDAAADRQFIEYNINTVSVELTEVF